MISTTNRGIIIKKIAYKEKHEILHILLETGKIESFFLENGQKTKKNKITIPCKVNIIYLNNYRMNRLIAVDVEDYYKNIVHDITAFMYVGNIIELITIVGSDNDFVNYVQLEEVLDKLNKNCIEAPLLNIFFICKLLNKEGFKFKYKKTDKLYVGYDFSLNLFTNEINKKTYPLSDKLVKLIHILSIKSDLNILESIALNEIEYAMVLEFLNQIMKEYIGVETVTYKKIQDLESLLYNFERKN
ncbi:MAG: DNA repair protein RecO [Gemella sp.]|nr:DNA repair protein RecO [Gemella sp.]